MDPRCRRASVGVTRLLLDGTDWAGIRRSHGSTRNTISANAVPNSIFLRARAGKASSMTRSYVRIVTCRYWYWERFYRCLVVCITTGNMWTDKRKRNFPFGKTHCANIARSCLFTLSRKGFACLRVSLLPPTHTTSHIQPSIKKIPHNASQASIWLSHQMLIEL